jgi:hypothetical protein
MISLDAFSLLKSIGAAEGAFASVETDIEKAALAIAIKAIKKSARLDQLRAICSAVGAGPLGIVIDSMKESEVSGLNKKLDKHWPALKSASSSGQREHLLALAASRAVPADKPVPAAKSTGGKSAKSKKSEEPNAEWSSAMSARPTRR